MSWFVGAPYGCGYCPFTDWHWRVRERLGYRDDPDFYMELLISEVFRIELSSFWADTLTGGVFALVALITIIVNLRDVRRVRRRRTD